MSFNDRKKSQKKVNDRFHVRDMYQVPESANVRKDKPLKRPPNAVYFNPKNSDEMELHKAVAGFTLNRYGIIIDGENMKSAIGMLAEVIKMHAKRKESPKWFITDAQQRKGCFGLDSPGKIRDLVVLDDHTPVSWNGEYETGVRNIRIGGVSDD